MFLKIHQIVKFLRNNDIPASRSSLLRWEEQGKIPKFRKTPGGWRYATKPQILKLIDILKSDV